MILHSILCTLLPLNYTLCIVLSGVIVMGTLSGILGVFVLLRGQSLLGDAVAHAALPGIALAFLLTNSTNQLLLMFGGACSGVMGILLMTLVTTYTKLKKDAAQGMVLSIFFGLGLVLLTIIQKQLISHQSVLNKFLFGNISTLLYNELYVITIASSLILLCITLFWKELIAFTFDASYIKTLGFNSVIITLLLNSTLLLTIMIGLQSMGVILMSTILIAPAAAARQWTSRVNHMAVLSAFFGALSGVLGVLLSSYTAEMPTGPMIVVMASIIVFISLICAPYRSILLSKIHRPA